MTQPTAAQIKALHHDAAMWSDMVSVMSAASTAVYDITVLFPRIAADVGLNDTYTEIQSKCGKLLSEGKTQFQNVSAALKRAADVFDGTDQENAATIKEIWEPK